MPPITATIDVNRSSGDVFAYATDPTRFCEWQKDVVDGRMKEPGAPGGHAQCVTTRRIGFANRSSTSELTHTDPPKTWGVRGIDGPIWAIVDLTVESLIVAYCRGPYCVYADEAVRQLSRSGRRAARLPDGYPEWARAGLPGTAAS